MARTHDVIVVGGGPAGSTAASYMAQHGYDVLLLEKEVFPRYRLGESLLPSTNAVLADLGLLDKMEEIGFPHKTGGSFSWGRDDTPWSVIFAENPFLPSTYGFHVDRSRFDAMLLDRSKELGVTVLQPCAARDVLVEDGRVVGVTYRDPETKETVEARARFVIDASGPASIVGRKLTTRTYDDRMRQTSVFTYYRDVAGEPEGQEGHVVVTACPKGWFWYIPMASPELGEASVGLVTGQEFRAELKELGALAFFDAALAEAPRVQAMLGPDARQIGKMRGIKDWAFACSQMAGPGFFLCGDSAAFIDPLLSTGVTLAMLAGYTASVCMHTVLQDASMEQAAIDFYDGNYKRMYAVTRDCLLYFYSNQDANADGVFWTARKLMQFGDNAGAKQSFSFLVNTVAGNPHPAARRQIHMFQQFMANLEHPLEQMAAEPAFQQLMSERSAEEIAFDAITDDTVLSVNGTLDDGCVIDDERHALRRVRGIAYDEDRPVFSSTASWLLGRNFAELAPEQVTLLDLTGGKARWGDVLGHWAQATGCSHEEARDALAPTLEALCAEKFVLLHAP